MALDRSGSTNQRPIQTPHSMTRIADKNAPAPPTTHSKLLAEGFQVEDSAQHVNQSHSAMEAILLADLVINKKRVGVNLVKSASTGPARAETHATNLKSKITNMTVRAVRSLVGADTSQDVDVHAPLMEMGLDSLASTDLVQQLGEACGVELPPTLLFDFPTVDTLTSHLAELSSAQDDDTSSSDQLMNSTEIKNVVVGTVIRALKLLLGVEPEHQVDINAPLMEMGLDSLASTEFLRQLGDEFQVQLPPTLLFDYPTVGALSSHLVKLVSPNGLHTEEIEVGSSMFQDDEEVETQDIALIGMSCRLPGGIEGSVQFWDASAAGRCMVGKVPFTRWDVDALSASRTGLSKEAQSRMLWGGFVEELELFDPTFFRISAAEASAMDPQQRLLLEYSWLALRGAGYTKGMLSDQKAGVFVGISSNDAAQVTAKASTSVYSANGTSHATAAGRVSFTFGLQGPCSAYDTACSSGLVALHAAVRCLEHRDCDLALVIGVNAMLTPSISEAFAVASITSPTGRCHTFDIAADGYVRGEGCGAVVLKRVGDAVSDDNRVYAVVRGVGVAQDGVSASLTAPNGKAQQKLLLSTLADGGESGDNVDYLEAHGTGTALGDPIEMGSAAAVFGAGRDKDYGLVMGAVKASIGHLESGAGTAGLIRTVLVLQHEQAPPNLELNSLNPKIGAVVEGFPVHFPVESESLRAHSRHELLKAGVSSFGYAGTIAHALVAQASGEVAHVDGWCAPDKAARILCRQTFQLSLHTAAELMSS